MHAEQEGRGGKPLSPPSSPFMPPPPSSFSRVCRSFPCTHPACSFPCTHPTLHPPSIRHSWITPLSSLCVCTSPMLCAARLTLFRAASVCMCVTPSDSRMKTALILKTHTDHTHITALHSFRSRATSLLYTRRLLHTHLDHAHITVLRSFRSRATSLLDTRLETRINWRDTSVISHQIAQCLVLTLCC